MNDAHIHLMFNHFPVVGSILAVIFLSVALFIKKQDITRAALVFVVVIGALSFPAHFSGENAEEMLEDMDGYSETLMHDHEEAGEKAFVVMGTSGAFALLILLLSLKTGKVPRWTLPAVLAATLVAAGLLGWTANLGGKISHPELRDNFVGEALDDDD